MRPLVRLRQKLKRALPPTATPTAPQIHIMAAWDWLSGRGAESAPKAEPEATKATTTIRRSRKGDKEADARPPGEDGAPGVGDRAEEVAEVSCVRSAAWPRCSRLVGMRAR